MSRKCPIIFGAGMAGLLAARMLADRHPLVMEKQSELPNNHHAVLRFRSNVVSEVTNIPFKEVKVSKHVLSDEHSNPIRDAAIYARKVTGKLHGRSIMDLKPVTRHIAPPDFVKLLSNTASIQFGVDFEDWSSELVRDHSPVISTLPLPLMVDLFKWPDRPNFGSTPGWTIKVELKPKVECQMYATIYSARIGELWYRASVTGNEVMIEGVGDPPELSWAAEIYSSVLWQMGIKEDDVYRWDTFVAKYQKVNDLTSSERESMKRFIMWLSSEHKIYSLGRFATWRPKLLIDDLVNDVRVIARLLDGESHYNETLNK